jgi:phenylacetate-CoA ligase
MGKTAVAHRRPSAALPVERRVSARALERLIAALGTKEPDLDRLAEDARVLLEGPVLDHASRRRLQLLRFRQLAVRALRQTDYYHALFTRLLVDPAHLNYEDIARLPTTPKEAVRDDPDAFVSHQARPFLWATTTGTTGTPTSICFSAQELRLYAALFALPTFFTHDLEASDLVQISTSARGTLGTVCLAGACAHVGAVASLAGVVEPALALAQLGERHHLASKKERISVLSTYPSYLGQLVEYGLAHGYRPSDFGLERISVGGEVVTEGLKKRAEQLFGPVRFIEGLGMTEIWPVGGRRCEAGHLHFTASLGLVEVQPLEGSRPVEAGDVGTLVVTPFAPYRDTTLLLRYETGDLVRLLPPGRACSLRHLPATSNLLGKRHLAVRHDQGWTFPRQVQEALEALDALPLPARCGFWMVPGGVAVEVQCRAKTPALEQQITESLCAWGVPVQSLHLLEPGQPLRQPLPLRCDLREQQFADPAPVQLMER